MPPSPIVKQLTPRVKRIRDLADDLTREFVRSNVSGLAAHAVAAAIMRELNLALRILKSDEAGRSAAASPKRR
jgi:hypothetical protein